MKSYPESSHCLYSSYPGPGSQPLAALTSLSCVLRKSFLHAHVNAQSSSGTSSWPCHGLCPPSPPPRPSSRCSSGQVPAYPGPWWPPNPVSPAPPILYPYPFCLTTQGPSSFSDATSPCPPTPAPTSINQGVPTCCSLSLCLIGTQPAGFCLGVSCSRSLP